jgi:hypothetical protein
VEESNRRRARILLVVLAAAVLLGVACYQHWSPLLTVSSDAEAGARLLVEHGFRGDYSGGSLWDLDRYAEAGLPGQGSRDEKVRELGAYAGEVIRRAKGGKWVASSSAPSGLELEVDGSRSAPHAHVARRVEVGRSEAIAPYARSLGVDVRPVPDWWIEAEATRKP